MRNDYLFEGLKPLALTAYKIIGIYQAGGKWLIIIGILIALGIYIRKKNRE